MLVKRIALLAAAAGMAIAPIANAAAAPARVGTPVTNANYQDGDRVGPMAVILVLIVAVLIGLAVTGGGDGPQSP